MKKIFAIIFVIVAIATVAYAATDLSSMSFDELMNLRNDLNAEIMSRPEWKEVTVPPGTWYVGEDIPAGTYSIKSEFCGVTVWREAKDDYDNNGLYYCEVVKKDSPCGKIKLDKGMVVEINGEVIFAPPMSLGF
jgi:hypothetical protein